jgi:hypothetical protein
MRVNIISNHSSKGLSQDSKILGGILYAMFEEGLQLKYVQYVQPECSEADVNVFLEVMNPSLLSYAATNIWIPNHEMTPKTWTPYLEMVDEIWTKTSEAERIFSSLTKKVRYVGWTSLNKQTPKRKNYYKAIVPIGKNFHREVEPVLSAYKHIKLNDRDLYSKLPILNIVSHKDLEIDEEIKDTIILHKNLSETDYNNLLTECGLCICLSRVEGFGHAINEAMASGCNLILSKISAFTENLAGRSASYCDIRETIENTECFGNFVFSSDISLRQLLKDYVETSFEERRENSEFVRQKYEANHIEWVQRMKTTIPEVFVEKVNPLPSEENLPNVSIVCVTKNRRAFMPILKYSYMIQSYPEDKLELIIVDDGEDSIEDTLFGVPNVVYVRLDEAKTIGEKRNIGVSRAMYDVITFMDDDDVYPNNSVLQRVAMMLKTPSKECGFCTTLPCYDITRYSSFMNVPPFQLEMSERVSEATLIFTKKFWEERKFSEIQIAEGDAFIRGREQMCRELSPQEVIVSLVHPLNTSSRKIPDFKEPNGCHYGFNEKLFAMVSEIGESLKAKDGGTA